MHQLLLDANFLVLPFQQSVALFDEFDRLVGEYTVHTLNRTYNEALQLEDGKYTGMVEELVQANDIEVMTVDMDGSVDDVLVALSDRFIVCTNDKGIRAELDRRTRPHIYLRQENRLEGAHLPGSLPF